MHYSITVLLLPLCNVFTSYGKNIFLLVFLFALHTLCFWCKFVLHNCVEKILCNGIVHIQCVCPCIAIKYLVQSKIIGVNCYFCCSFFCFLFCFCFLFKPGVYCQAKYQNKLEKKTPLHIFSGRTME